uniref:Putative conserved plasma membrane protein n=1 Tax=Nyssomyia neivai TaxID=330878 RepID=A0A1L8D9J7_9DIPT
MKNVQKNFRDIHGKELRVEINSFSVNTISICVENTESLGKRRKFLQVAGLTGCLYAALVFMGNPFGIILGHILMLSLILLPFYLHRKVVESESITFIRHFGIQKRVKYSENRMENRLIPAHAIQDIIINEVIHRQRVIFVLQLLLEGSTDVQVLSLFEFTKPNLPCLEFIYKTLHDRWKIS